MVVQPDLHPDMQVLIDARGAKAPDASVHEQRQQWSDYASKLSKPCPKELEVSDVHIPTGGREVPVRLYRHRERAGLQPCVIYMHGGGFMLGDLDSSDSIAWGFAIETGSTVVSIDYRLTPEHVWPAAFEDCFSVLCWVSENGEDIGVDTSRIALAGDSAGGRLASGLCIKARDHGGLSVVAQAAVYASAGAIPDSRSREDFAEGYGLTTARHKHFYKLLFPDNRYDEDPYAWPIRAKDLSNLPPTLIHTAECDPIRDDGRAFAARLALAGSPVVYREARGMMHGFMRARFFGSAAKAEFDFICAFLRAHLLPDGTG